jgi:hypothetical protein
MSKNSQKYTQEGQILLNILTDCLKDIKNLRQIITNKGTSSQNFQNGKTNLVTKVLELLSKIEKVKQEFKNEVIKLMVGLTKNNLPTNLQNYKTSVKPTPIMKMDKIINGINGIKKAKANRAAAAAARGRAGVKKAVAGVKMGMRLKKNANKTRQTELNNLNNLEKQLSNAKKNIGNNNSNVSNNQGKTGFVSGQVAALQQ